LIEIASDHVLVLRIKEHEAPRIKNMEEVTANITNLIKKEKAQDKVKETTDAIVEKLKSGESTAWVADEFKVEWKVNEAAKRFEAGLDREIVSKAFELTRPAEGDKTIGRVEMLGGDQAVLVVTKVTEGAYTLSQSEAKQRKKMLAGRNGYFDFDSLLRNKKTKAKVEKKNLKTEES
jgi:peptidyl-prolyl cis-trans isomerase D